MFAIFVASFVIACCLLTSVLVTFVLRSERQKRADSEIILAAEPLKPEWLYPRRMDVPKKFGIIRTRSTKALR